MSKSRRHYKRSLARKLGLTVLVLSAIVFVVVTGTFFLQSRYLIRQEAINKASCALNATAMHITRQLNTVATATESNYWLITTHLRPDSLLDYSRRVLLMNANVDGCSISMEPYHYPKHGRYFSAYSVRIGDSIASEIEAPYEYFEKSWYKMPKAKGKACWVDPFYDHVDGSISAEKTIVSYCKPILNTSGMIIGVLSCDLALNTLIGITHDMKPYPNAYFTLVGKDGRFLMHPDQTKMAKQTLFSGRDTDKHQDIIKLGHEMIAGKTGSMRIRSHGVPSIVCYQPIADTDWSLALVCSEADVLKGYNQMAYLILPMLILGLFVITLLSNLIVNGTIRPITELVEQSKRIAQGEYHLHIEHTRRADAIGKLQNSFATMQESLEKNTNSILQMIDETKLRNKELHRARLLAEEGARQKTAFIQNMTHQIRTPLNIIMGFSQVLNDNYGQLPKEEVDSINSMIRHNSGHLTRMMLMLYDSSDTGISEELSLQHDDVVAFNDMARECIDFTRLHFPDIHITWETELPDDLTTRTNHLYMMRSLREMLYNAAKYSDGRNISLRMVRTADTVRMIIQDTGPGIPESYYPMLFTSFTKVNDLTEGLGLGLPLTKQHVVRLGGTLTFDTSYHDGCRFIIEFPL